MTTTQLLLAPALPRTRTSNIILWVAQLLLAALYAFGGFSKLVNPSPEVVAGFELIGFGTWFQYLTGTLELLGAVGLLVPRLSWLAALGLAGVMLAAVLIQLLILPPAAVAIVPGIMAAILLLLAWFRRPLLAR